MSRNRLFSLSAAVYGCTVGRAFTPAALLILQRKRCFVFFEFAEVRRAKSPALRNRGKHGGQPGKRGAALQQTPVGDDARIVPGTPRRRGRSREGHAPPLQTYRTRSTKPDKRSHPGGRRAGCPHPAGPCGGVNARGRDKSRPYDQRKVRTHRGTALSTVSQTSVGDDARTAPAGTFRRPKTAGPALRPEIVPGTPQHRKVPGRGMPLPYKPSEHDQPNRTSAAARAAVGRGDLTPPDPAAA